ncbi:MAG: BlaI/MecI/CopY family transcriptional regulator [Prevotella sp.]|jgi:predicted transcriptional regulator|nr:BlaI/MecI/CopY family transcriptional regulator [Prevotella sp.]
MKDKSQLTKAETQVMNALWSLPQGQGRSSEIMEQMPEPKPALTTLLTFLKILKEKGFVATEKLGKGQLFKALVSRNDYTRTYMKEVKNAFFGGSLSSLVSFFAKNEELSQQEIDEISQIVENLKK